MTERGKYIVVEGGDGTGKSTQVALLQKLLYRSYGIRSIQIHEPDGFEGSEELGLPHVSGATELRKIIKNGSIPRDPWTNVMMFSAARRLNWEQAMKPALEKGLWVLAARSYISTVSYQGYGEGVDIDDILQYTVDNVGTDYVTPDAEMILTLNDESIRTQRIAQRGPLENPDTFESKSSDFQSAMQSGYELFGQLRDIPLISANVGKYALLAKVINEPTMKIGGSDASEKVSIKDYFRLAA